MEKTNSKIILGISGSIAAYKTIELAKKLINKGYEIEIVLTKAASTFVSPLTLKTLFPGKVHEYRKTLATNDEIMHITLAKNAKYVLIAPASANLIARLSMGLADCLLSSLCLATNAPVILAPAMNKVMWANSIVQNNVKILKEHNIHIIDPEFGHQACSDIGVGRMAGLENIMNYISFISTDKILMGKKLVITAGPTREKIDPIRFLSNYSSGKMGYAIAKAAYRMGATVTLISGPTYLTPPEHVNFIQIENAEEMYKIALDKAKDADAFIGAAAVTDYKVNFYSHDKIKKTGKGLSVELKENHDIIKEVKKHYHNVICIGFAAETSNFIEYAYNKLNEKQLDIIAVNDVSEGKVFNSEYNELQIITKCGQLHHLSKSSKDHIAEQLLKIVSTYIIP